MLIPGRGWVPKLRHPGRGLGLAVWKQTESAGVWQLRVYVEEAWAHQRSREPLLGWAHEERGRTTIGASFPVHALRQQVTVYMSSGGGHKLPLPSQAPEAGMGQRCCCREKWKQAPITAPTWRGPQEHAWAATPAHPLARE